MNHPTNANKQSKPMFSEDEISNHCRTVEEVLKKIWAVKDVTITYTPNEDETDADLDTSA